MGAGVALKQQRRLPLRSLYLFLAIGIGLILGIQIRLLAYTHQTLSPNPPKLNFLSQPLPIERINSVSLQQAIQTLSKQSPIFIFGHSTGHSGSGTFHESLAQSGCPWNITVDKFEYRVEGETNWTYNENEPCGSTERELVPHLVEVVKSKARKVRGLIDDDDKENGEDFGEGSVEERSRGAASKVIDEPKSLDMLLEGLDKESIAFIDLGHFHNPGRTLECLAKQLGEKSVFIHIRRNRYSIARSFTPSKTDELSDLDFKQIRRENKMVRREGQMHQYRERADLERYRVRHDESDGSEDEAHRRSSGHRVTGGDLRQYLDQQLVEAGNKDVGTDRLQNFVEQQFSETGYNHANVDHRQLQSESHVDKSPDRVALDRYHGLNDRSESDQERGRRKRRHKHRRSHGESNNTTKVWREQTPCLVQNIVNGKNLSHPSVAICPRSTEDGGPVDLPISSDNVWDSLTPFQQFLWYVDEMEHRWHTLQKMFYTNHIISPEPRRHVPGGDGKPTFIEVTWDSKDELHDGINWVRKQFGCTPAHVVTNVHPHVKHNNGTANCTQYIWEDLEYRKLMRYDITTSSVLFPHHLPQHVDSRECSEDRNELEMKIRQYSDYHGILYDPGQWKLPD